MRSLHSLTRAAVLAVTFSLLPTLASAQQTVRIAQGFASLSFLPVWAARALNTFPAEGLTATAIVSNVTYALPASSVPALWLGATSDRTRR